MSLNWSNKMSGLTKEDMDAALSAVGQKLESQGLRGEILILGGAYMTLIIKNRLSTKDIDAYLISERPALREAVTQVAQEQGLPDDWLNDAVKGFLYTQPASELWRSYPGLDVYTPEPEYIFAMKAESARANSFDFQDLEAVKNFLGLRSAEEALAIIEKYIPLNKLSPKTQYVIENLFEQE
jgi:hypothetical protein